MTDTIETRTAHQGNDHLNFQLSSNPSEVPSTVISDDVLIDIAPYITHDQEVDLENSPPYAAEVIPKSESEFVGIIGTDEINMHKGFDTIAKENFEGAWATVVRTRRGLTATRDFVCNEAKDDDETAMKYFSSEEAAARKGLDESIAALRAIYEVKRQRLSNETIGRTSENERNIVAANAKLADFSPILDKLESTIHEMTVSHGAYEARRDDKIGEINSLSINCHTLENEKKSLVDRIETLGVELSGKIMTRQKLVDEMTVIQTKVINEKQNIAEGILFQQERKGESFTPQARRQATIKIMSEITLNLPGDYTNLDLLLTGLIEPIQDLKDTIALDKETLIGIEVEIDKITSLINALSVILTAEIENNAHNNMDVSRTAVDITDMLDAVRRGDMSSLVGKKIPVALVSLYEKMLQTNQLPTVTTERNFPESHKAISFDDLAIPDSLQTIDPNNPDEILVLSEIKQNIRTGKDLSEKVTGIRNVLTFGVRDAFKSIRNAKKDVSITPKRH